MESICERYFAFPNKSYTATTVNDKFILPKCFALPNELLFCIMIHDNYDTLDSIKILRNLSKNIRKFLINPKIINHINKHFFKRIETDTEITYMFNGLEHNFGDNPSYIYKPEIEYQTISIMIEGAYYCFCGGEPVSKTYRNMGRIKFRYCKFGKRHRDPLLGPAIIGLNQTRQFEKYYYNDKKVTSQPFYLVRNRRYEDIEVREFTP